MAPLPQNVDTSRILGPTPVGLTVGRGWAFFKSLFRELLVPFLLFSLLNLIIILPPNLLQLMVREDGNMAQQALLIIGLGLMSLVFVVVGYYVLFMGWMVMVRLMMGRLNHEPDMTAVKAARDIMSVFWKTLLLYVWSIVVYAAFFIFLYIALVLVILGGGILFGILSGLSSWGLSAFAALCFVLLLVGALFCFLVLLGYVFYLLSFPVMMVGEAPTQPMVSRVMEGYRLLFQCGMRPLGAGFILGLVTMVIGVCWMTPGYIWMFWELVHSGGSPDAIRENPLLLIGLNIWSQAMFPIVTGFTTGAMVMFFEDCQKRRFGKDLKARLVAMAQRQRIELPKGFVSSQKGAASTEG